MSPLTEARSARSWCDEERAPYSTKGEKVSPLTEARSARSEGIASERSNSSGGELSRIERRNRQVPANAMKKERCIAGPTSR